MHESFPVLGFDIGGTKIAICLGTSDGKILGSERITSKGKGPAEVLPELVSIGRKLLKDAAIPPGKLKAIGISAPAPMDILKGTISPTNMKKWVDVPVRDYLAEAFGVPAYFDNDANAGALAEWIFGAGKGSKDMIYLTLSTGAGSAGPAGRQPNFSNSSRMIISPMAKPTPGSGSPPTAPTRLS